MSSKVNSDDLIVRPKWLTFALLRGGSSCCGCSLRAASAAAAAACTAFDLLDLGLAGLSLATGDPEDVIGEYVGVGLSVISIICK